MRVAKFLATMVLILHVGVIGCRKAESKPTLLIGILKSKTSQDAALSQLALPMQSFQVIQSEKLPKREKRPEFNLVTLQTNDFVHMGQRGSLELQFWNGQLYGVKFFPSDISRYVVQLKTAGTDLGSGEKIVDQHTRVFKSSNADGKPFVGWEDTYLTREIDQWIADHS